MSFLSIYEKEFEKKLDLNGDGRKRGLRDNVYNRAEGFRIIFEQLEKEKKLFYHIVETGSLRDPHDWKAGRSSVLFQEFVNYHNGLVESVDIDPKVVEVARNFLGDKCNIHLGDSVEFLSQHDWEDVCLFYLDSYDVKWGAPLPSAEHHLNEFLAIEKYMKKGVILAIDDNSFFMDNGNRTGKGMLIVDYLRRKKIKPIFDSYQIIYQF